MREIIENRRLDLSGRLNLYIRSVEPPKHTATGLRNFWADLVGGWIRNWHENSPGLTWRIDWTQFWVKKHSKLTVEFEGTWQRSGIQAKFEISAESIDGRFRFVNLPIQNLRDSESQCQSRLTKRRSKSCSLLRTTFEELSGAWDGYQVLRAFLLRTGTVLGELKNWCNANSGNQKCSATCSTNCGIIRCN